MVTDVHVGGFVPILAAGVAAQFDHELVGFLFTVLAVLDVRDGLLQTMFLQNLHNTVKHMHENRHERWETLQFIRESR